MMVEIRIQPYHPLQGGHRNQQLEMELWGHYPRHKNVPIKHLRR